MPLPSGGTWPPQHLNPIYQHYSVLDAWYRGDPDRLADLYGDPAAHGLPANRPSQYRGGILGKAARWFWGEPTPAGQKQAKVHLPAASDLATMGATLLYSEPPTITVENAATQERINDLLPSLQATLLEGAEVGGALGSYYLRSVWDRAVAEKPWISAVHADACVPEWRHGRLYAATFWRIIQQDDTEQLIHLERHEPGYILNGLYRGSPGNLGDQVQLTSRPETKDLPPVIQTKLPRCTAVHVPNMRPQRMWRHYPPGAPLGRSDYDDAIIGLMDKLDETWTSWMRDIRNGLGRIHVPSSYLQSNGPGKGAFFDTNREIYEAMNVLGGDDRMEISISQFAIRVQEHKDTQAELLDAILRASGYSSQSFGLHGEVAQTATEVSAKERRSLTTRGVKGLYTIPELQTMLDMHLQLEVALGFSPDITPERPSIVLADSVVPDMLQLAQTVNFLRQAEAASDETLVRMVHPDWDETEVQAEVERIADARPKPAPDPFALPDEMTGPDEGGDPGAQDGPQTSEGSR
ncbi:hypothetical protein ABT340_04740 [Streptosporangium sp. NPDC000239]|uniref:hypothetical protein n=1 Tax=Streptosporangium sp. NPDC000239 TaxID=3154248 RepID=UPI00331FC9FC